MSTHEAGRIPAEYAGLVDDAAIFPPGDAPLGTALRDHVAHRQAWYADLLGPFVVDDRRLAELVAVVPGDEPLAVTVVVTGGAGGLAPVVERCARADRVRLRSVEVALRDLDDLPSAARRVAAAAGAVDVPVFVEVPLADPRADPASPGWLSALDEVAAAGLHLKLRTGGLERPLFPSGQDLARALDAALDRELVFKCTAGLHGAAAHVDAATGFAHQGFLGVLLATRAALDGADVEAVAAVLADPAVGPGVAAHTPERLVAARRWFTSFGCCGVLDPLHGLQRLGLVATRP